MQMSLQMLREICEAVYNCHSRRIIHRDLKPENVLLDSERRVKLGTDGRRERERREEGGERREGERREEGGGRRDGGFSGCLL